MRDYYMRLSEDLAIPGASNLANEASHIFYITEKLAHQHVQDATFGLFTAASLFKLTGWFHIHLFVFI